MSFYCELDPEGIQMYKDAVARLGAETLAGAIKPVLQEGAELIVQEAQAEIMVMGIWRSGALYRAMAVGRLITRNRSMLIWAAAGVAKTYERWEGKEISPFRYAHLVERGFIQKVGQNGRRGVGHIAARPFMRRAWDRAWPKILDHLKDALERLLQS